MGNIDPSMMQKAAEMFSSMSPEQQEQMSKMAAGRTPPGYPGGTPYQAPPPQTDTSSFFAEDPDKDPELDSLVATLTKEKDDANKHFKSEEFKDAAYGYFSVIS